MKAEELMRFDWIHLTNDDTPRQVDWIRSGEVGLFWNQTVTPPYLEPIPLTAEILENNADGGWCNYSDAPSGRAIYHFGKVAIYVEWERYQPYVELHGFGSTFFKDYIPSVHKLQHALRLCGIEKEIVL